MIFCKGLVNIQKIKKNKIKMQSLFKNTGRRSGLRSDLFS